MTISWVLLYVWVILTLVLFFGWDFSLIVLFIVIARNSTLGFIYLELFFVGVLLVMMYSSSTYERSGSYIYLSYFSLVIGFVLVSVFDMNVAGLIVILVVLAKLPLFGLHAWLPKVHVEASILGSIFLARLILKRGTILYYLMGEVILFGGILIMLCAVVIMRYVDRKGVVAISSVLHIGSSVLFLGMTYIVGFTHILVSPLIFLGVYVIYNYSGSRIIWSIGSIVILVNLGFPCLGAFFCEIFISYILLVIVFVVGYYLSIIFAIHLYINDVKTINWWLVGRLLCLIILW